ncbi:MAG: thiamine pyrophosphate-binding protein [Acidobacteriota bacterium]
MSDRAAPRWCSAEALFGTLQRLGMTHLLGVPDNGTAALFARAGEDPTVTRLTVTREGEAIAAASGLWLGGKQPVVALQNTGLLESGDSLRGTAYRMGVPLPLLVGVRGHAKMVAHQRDIERARVAGHMPQVMKRADIDSVALVTEATLEAWRIPFMTYAGEADAEELTFLWNLAHDAGHPIAVLLPFPLQ